MNDIFLAKRRRRAQSWGMAIILEVSLTHETTYEMPEVVYEVILSMLEDWPKIYGHRPKPSVKRCIDLLKGYAPEMFLQVKIATKKREPVVSGLAPSHIFYDEIPGESEKILHAYGKTS